MKFSACLNNHGPFLLNLAISLSDMPEELADCLHMYTEQAQ